MTGTAAADAELVDIEQRFDDQVWLGVQTLLDEYIGVRADDTVVLLYTSDSYRPAAWVCAAFEVRGLPLRRVWMAPLVDAGFSGRLRRALPPSDALPGRLVVLSLERDTMSHGAELRHALAGYDPRRCLVLRAISAAATVFRHPLRVGPAELSARNAAVLEALLPARRLRITTPGGTDLTVALDPRHRWISNRGVGRPGSVLILPAGEVATYPAAIDGAFVADFAFNVNAITGRDARLHEHPVTVIIAAGRAVHVECADPATAQFLDTCLTRLNADHVGELGFGTNPAVDHAIRMNSHTNERRPGVHLGFGQHNQDHAVVAYHSPIHLDLIARGGLIDLDTQPSPLDLEQLPTPAGPHPPNLLEQDVSSASETDLDVEDCCGLLDHDGLHLFTGNQA